MSHPLIMLDNSKAKYDTLLQEAEAERQYRKAKKLNQNKKIFSLSGLLNSGQTKTTTGQPALETK